MRREDISEAVGNISTNHIQEAAPYRKNVKKHRWMKWGAIAACFAVLVTVMLPLMQNSAEPPAPNTENPPPASTQIPDNAVPPANTNGLHLVQLVYTDPAAPKISTEFIIYINPDAYTSQEENGTYSILPAAPMNAALPECSLRIYRIADAPPATAAEFIQESLEAKYVNVDELADSTALDGLFLHADNGNAWDAEQVDVTITDDLLGGSYVLTARYFTEATEGHGVRFADMVSTFKAMTSADSAAMPTHLAQLYQTISAFMPAFFADNASDLHDFLAQDAQTSTYGTDLMDDVSIASVDYRVRSEENLLSAVVSVKHRISTEDSYNYLTIELTYTAGREWVVHFAGIEK